MISNGDSPAGPSMMSPEMYQTFALPYEKKVCDWSHQQGLPYLLHICGNTDIILDDMISVGVDVLELDYLTKYYELKNCLLFLILRYWNKEKETAVYQ